MIDVNVTLHRWPFRRVFGDDPVRLVEHLRQKGVTQAWAGSFEGLFQRDISAVNARLAGDCERYGPKFLLPFGSINPKLPDWQEDLRRCHEVHHMPGIRLHPNYDSYTLADPDCADLLNAAAGRRLIVQVTLGMEDERTQNPIMRVPVVNPAPLIELVKRMPALRMVVLNGNRIAQAAELSAAGDVHFDMSMVEGVGGVARFAKEVSAKRILFGSHFPLFYFESSELKIKEAGLPAEEQRAITEANAKALMER